MVLELLAIALNYENKTDSILVMIIIIVPVLMLMELLLQICSLAEFSTRNSPPVTWFINLRPNYMIFEE